MVGSGPYLQISGLTEKDLHRIVIGKEKSFITLTYRIKPESSVRSTHEKTVLLDNSQMKNELYIFF